MENQANTIQQELSIKINKEEKSGILTIFFYHFIPPRF